MIAGSRILASIVVIALMRVAGASQHTAVAPPNVIVSPTHPRDSLGESVYDLQSVSTQEAAVVPGTLIPPVLDHAVKLKVPFSSRMHHRIVSFELQGVVTAKGEVIDAMVLQPGDDEALVKGALDAFRQWRYKPGTLDGKPVAVLVQQQFRYKVF